MKLDKYKNKSICISSIEQVKPSRTKKKKKKKRMALNKFLWPSKKELNVYIVAFCEEVVEQKKKEIINQRAQLDGRSVCAGR